jgi:hypothetical protein
MQYYAIAHIQPKFILVEIKKAANNLHDSCFALLSICILKRCRKLSGFFPSSLKNIYSVIDIDLFFIFPPPLTQ